MAETKRRRVRVQRKGRTEGLHKRSNELQELIETVHKQNAIAERAKIKAVDAMAVVQEIMETNKQTKVVSDHAVAEMVTPRSNSRTVVDPVKFRAAVTDDGEFYSAVTIGVTAAKKVLSEKALNKISTKKSGEKKDPTLKVRPRKDDD